VQLIDGLDKVGADAIDGDEVEMRLVEKCRRLSLLELELHSGRENLCSSTPMILRLGGGRIPADRVREDLRVGGGNDSILNQRALRSVGRQAGLSR